MKKKLSVTSIVDHLTGIGDESYGVWRANKFGIRTHNSLGISNQHLRLFSKELEMDEPLAYELFSTGIYEAALLVSYSLKPKQLSKQMIDDWILTFTTWEICDAFALSLFSRSTWVTYCINQYAMHELEYVKRTAFSTLAGYALKRNKKVTNNELLLYIPIMHQASTDERPMVKKAISWAMRTIGKRNKFLKQELIEQAIMMKQAPNEHTRWIGSDVYRELIVK
jgi:3-methyladenine DNA glycosylase AlkD